MADSDDEAGASKDDIGLDLTSFMFGNIDTTGQLEEEFLDESTKRSLNSLGNMLSGTNLVSLAREVSIEAEEGKKEIEEEDFNEKAEDAEDYSNIDEMMDDDTSSDESDDSDEEEKQEESKGGEKVTETNEEADEQDNKGEPVKESSPVETEKTNDSMLMPPPPGPVSSSSTPATVNDSRLSQPGSSSGSSSAAPLAGMLPDKYKNVDVKTFFPEFKENSVLRFSKLFPIKESHKPRTWKALKKRRRKEMNADNEDSENSAKKMRRGWDYVVPMPTDPEAYQECQSVRFLKPAEVKLKIS